MLMSNVKNWSAAATILEISLHFYFQDLGSFFKEFIKLVTFWWIEAIPWTECFHPEWFGRPFVPTLRFLRTPRSPSRWGGTTSGADIGCTWHTVEIRISRGILIIDSHLLALLDERRERVSQVLHQKGGIVSGEVDGRLDGDVVQNERTHHAVHSAHAKLVQILSAYRQKHESWTRLDSKLIWGLKISFS